jgi:hypothetical protein
VREEQQSMSEGEAQGNLQDQDTVNREELEHEHGVDGEHHEGSSCLNHCYQE